MNDYFIEKIEIKENYHIQKLDIPLSTEQRKHLIFTGKNGSGKTTTLKEINILLNKLIDNEFATITNVKKNIMNYINAIIQENKEIDNHTKQIEEQNKQKELLEVNDINSNKIKITQID